jgi:predicted MFS family arabinose efflux permease
MAVLMVLLPLIMERDDKTAAEKAELPRYGELLRSLWPIMKSLPEVPLGGVIQALSFGLFLALWLAIGLHLPRNGYGVDTVGYISVIAMINIATSPFVGKFVDKIGGERARNYFCLLQMTGVFLLPFAGDNLLILVIAIIFNTLGGASIDICSRTIMFKRAPEIRTRLMTIYIVIMFIGGGLSSWLGTAVYEYYGWDGISVMAIIYATTIMALSTWGRRFQRAETSAVSEAP